MLTLAATLCALRHIIVFELNSYCSVYNSDLVKNDLTFVLGGQDELVVRVVVVSVQLLVVVDDTRSVDGEMVVAHVVHDLGVLARVRVHGLHFQYGRPEWYVFVHVVRLVIGQLELGRVVVDVRHADGELRTGRQARYYNSGARIL